MPRYVYRFKCRNKSTINLEKAKFKDKNNANDQEKQWILMKMFLDCVGAGQTSFHVSGTIVVV